MYIAHLEKAYVIKRMPYSGANHGPGCESYEAPPGLSGRGEVDGQAIEHDDEGTVNLKLAFSLRHNNPAEMDKSRSGKVPPKPRVRASRCAASCTTFGKSLNSLTGNRR